MANPGIDCAILLSRSWCNCVCVTAKERATTIQQSMGESNRFLQFLVKFSVALCATGRGSGGILFSRNNRDCRSIARAVASILAKSLPASLVKKTTSPISSEVVWMISVKNVRLTLENGVRSSGKKIMKTTYTLGHLVLLSWENGFATGCWQWVICNVVWNDYEYFVYSDVMEITLLQCFRNLFDEYCEFCRLLNKTWS